MGVVTWCAGVAAGVLMAFSAQAGEVELIDKLEADVTAAFARADYKWLEDRYAAAMAKGERTPSGMFVANVIRVTVVPKPTGESKVPGRDDHWLPVEQKLNAWAAQFPQSSLVAGAQSWAYLAHGWSWRGSGYARSVPTDGFKKVEEYGQRSYDALMAREKVGRKDPYWYAQMLAVTRVQGWAPDRFFKLAQEAIAAFPLNYDIYFATSVRLQPRWGGSADAIADFASYAVEQTRKKEGESMYARIYWHVGEALDTELSGPDVNWKRIRAGFDDIVKRYPDSWNLNHYARMACLAGDAPTARRVLARMKDEVEQTAWPDRVTYRRCVQFAGVAKEGK
jgi:hypothetical protein